MTYLWLRTWQLGIKSLMLHPLRSMLTVLGIFIGVASVIWLLAIGEGISQKAQEQIAALGANNIIVRSVKPPDEASSSSGGTGVTPYGLTRDDYYRIMATIPTIDRATPVREVRRMFYYGGRELDGRLVGCTPEYMEINNLRMDRGRFLEALDCHKSENFCILGSETAEVLFPVEDPIGCMVRVQDQHYLVIGVTKPRMSSAGIGGSLSAQDFNRDVYIPIDTFWDRLGDFIRTTRSGSMEGEMLEVSQVTLRVDNVDDVMETAEIVRLTLEPHHKTEDYAITVPLELLEQAKTTRMMFIVFMGLIAAVSLVVGGIGIMNIMLATVTERTREIGIRRALGAKRADIIRQFLVETIALSVVGGVVGVLAGLTCRPVMNTFRAILEESMPDVIAQLPPVIQDVEPIIVTWSIPLAFMISVGIGVIFGLYPAMRAADMDPIEALRHE
jgi:putative ABC transport system permease protein